MNTSYNNCVAIFDNARLNTHPIKLNDEEKAVLERISKAKDRPIGYIIRELMWRGFLKFAADGIIKPTEEEAEEIDEIASQQAPFVGGVKSSAKTKLGDISLPKKEKNKIA